MRERSNANTNTTNTHTHTHTSTHQHTHAYFQPLAQVNSTLLKQLKRALESKAQAVFDASGREAALNAEIDLVRWC